MDIIENEGDWFYIYDPLHSLTGNKQFPFATLVTKDVAASDWDTKSKLYRPGVFRLNISVGRESFRSLFGDETEEGNHDYAALDVVMPHPAYGRNYWICVLNPSDETFQSILPLLREAYNRMTTAYERILVTGNPERP